MQAALNQARRRFKRQMAKRRLRVAGMAETAFVGAAPRDLQQEHVAEFRLLAQNTGIGGKGVYVARGARGNLRGRVRQWANRVKRAIGAIADFIERRDVHARNLGETRQ